MPSAERGTRVLLMSPQGRRFDQKLAEAYSRERHLILVAGHYEGVDQRVADHLVDDEVSIGDYVLTNGALAALVVTDAIVRLIPGVLGDQDSAVQDSFSSGLLTAPITRDPKTFAAGRCRMSCSPAIMLPSKPGEDRVLWKTPGKDGPTCYNRDVGYFHTGAEFIS